MPLIEVPKNKVPLLNCLASLSKYSNLAIIIISSPLSLQLSLSTNFFSTQLLYLWLWFNSKLKNDTNSTEKQLQACCYFDNMKKSNETHLLFFVSRFFITHLTYTKITLRLYLASISSRFGIWYSIFNSVFVWITTFANVL